MSGWEREYENILAERSGALAIVTLNRPKAHNALSSGLLGDLANAFEALAEDDEIRCVILAGSDQAFCAGADIQELSGATAVDIMSSRGMLSAGPWKSIAGFKKPIVAAVSGYALGGGLELAMSCDMVVASESASFGLPEIKLGVIPGGGGTQRLTHAVGKARAMEMLLTGRSMDAREAYEAGLVTKVASAEGYLDEAKTLAGEIVEKSPLAVQIAKDSALAAFEPALEQGLERERRNFFILLSSEDKEEGTSAFLEKRKPEFKGR